MALVEAFDNSTGMARIRQRGKFLLGDTLEVLSPGCPPRTFVAEEIRNETGAVVESTPHADELLYLRLPFEAAPCSMVRKKVNR